MEWTGHSEHLTAAVGMTQVWRPDTTEEAWRLKRQYGTFASYVAGGTWLRTRWESGSSVLPPYLISLDKIAPLQAIQQLESEQEAVELRIGAAVTLAAIESHPLAGGAVPLLGKAVSAVAAPSVRRQATIGGNVMSRSGDLIPALLALDAVIVSYSQGQYERQPLAEWLAGDGGDCDKLTVGFELKQVGGSCWFRKIGRRETFTPSVITIACAYRADSTAGRLLDVRIAVGGAGMAPVRLYEAETAAESGASGASVYAAVRKGIPSVADDYASAAYRRMAAANVIAAELDRAASG
ncbi:FAD binding domain-containing protein [Paenibacillus kobensis]|uniref:FAD binding domain-containing protein n=1 Tax=Paenibacillus kobensis TaxID=59841 RepID=UPI000FD78CEB|nr:FAD binding domain-containing protein [Paenibacillus kobensis]